MQLINQVYIGSNNRQSVYDLTIPANYNRQIILFIHGYKGFKDWGAWWLLEKRFVEQGFGFCKFNLSHNGGTVDNPIDFPDLEAFSENCYSYEKNDVLTMIDLLASKFPNDHIVLVGHSRGGGNALLCGTHPKVSAVITLAAISSIKHRFRHTEIMEKWKTEQVRYELNTRTNQQMPIKYNQYLDFVANEQILDIEASCRQLHKPCLHFHGKNDEAIHIDEAIDIASWTKQALYVLEDCNHVFGISHPWTSAVASEHFEFIIAKSIEMLTQNKNHKLH